MKDKVKVVLELTRPRNSVMSFFGVIVGMLLISNIITLNTEVLLAALTAMLILGGGNALNDYFDFNIDKVNRPNRPIPSGRISRRSVKYISAILFLAGIVLAFFVNVYCLALAAVNSVILIAYAKYSKKALLLSNLAISYLTASIFIYGALSIYNTGHFNPDQIGILAVLIASSFLMTLSREIIKDIEDMEGDLKMSANTLPIKIGSSKSKQIAITSGLISVAVSFIPTLNSMGDFNTCSYVLFIIPATLIFISSYFKTVSKNQKLIALGMIVSLIAFLAGRVTV